MEPIDAMETRATKDEGLSELGAVYLDLLAGCLTRSIFGGETYQRWEPAPRSPLRLPWLVVQQLLAIKQFCIVRAFPYHPHHRENGMDWPAEAETMVGLKRLRNIRQLLVAVVRSGVPGDFVETGVWRGGASIFARGVLRVLGDSSRTVWVCDSFEGLPVPSGRYDDADAGDKHHLSHQLSISEEQVRANFERYSLLDYRVRFVKGWFKDTLPSLPVKCIAILRLDGDMYESTMDALLALYDRVSSGGYIIVDDFGAIDGCKRAIQEFRQVRGIDAPLVSIDWTAVYWRKD